MSDVSFHTLKVKAAFLSPVSTFRILISGFMDTVFVVVGSVSCGFSVTTTGFTDFASGDFTGLVTTVSVTGTASFLGVSTFAGTTGDIAPVVAEEALAHVPASCPSISMSFFGSISAYAVFCKH